MQVGLEHKKELEEYLGIETYPFANEENNEINGK